MDTLTLHIEIVGLCLLAVEEHQMHLLLPSTSRPCFQHDLPHNAVFGFSIADEPGPDDFTDVPFSDAELDLSSLGGAAFQTPHLPEVVDISRFTRRNIDPALLQGPTPACVRSRIKITSGHAVPVRAEAEWLLPGHGDPVALTHRLRWVIDDVPRENLQLSMQGIHGTSSTGTPLLNARGKSVHLRVLHAPYNETPRDPVSSEAAGHFAAYYGLFPDTADWIVPLFHRRRLGSVTTRQKQKNHSAAGHLLTCMLAQAPVGP